MKEFKEKSAEELKEMDSDALQAYYIEKLTSENDALEVRLKSLEDAKGDTEAYAKLSEEVKELKENSVKTLKLALKEQGHVIDGLRKGKVSGTQLNEIEGSIEKALEDNAENFKSHTKDGGNSNQAFTFNLDLKAVGDMTFAANVTGVMPQAQRLEGVNDIAEQAVVTYPLIPKLNTDRNTIEWVYETGQEGTPGGTAENVTKNQIDNDFVVTSVTLLKQTAFFKVSTEMLDDVSFLAGWLRNKLIVRLFIVIDTQVLQGDGTGTNLNGVITQSTTWAAGNFANVVDNANDVDSLVVGKTQIKTANQGTGNLTIMMHPEDVAGLLLTKLSTTDKRYIDRLMMVGSTLMLDGTPIIENNDITPGDFLIADFSKAIVVQKSGISVEVGLDGNDFTKNMRTILAEWRGEVIIQNNDVTAFITGTFATTNAALETA